MTTLLTSNFLTSSFNIDAGVANLRTTTAGATQQRLGTSLGISLSSQQQVQGNNIRDVNIQPFIRSRVLKVTGRALKPSCRIYAFFDGIDVSSYVTPTTSAFVATGAEGATLTTDSSGNFYGLFRIPNTSAMRFRIGEKVFRLTDSSTNSSLQGSVTTAAQTTYAAQGLNTQSTATVPPDTAPNQPTPVVTTQQATPLLRNLAMDRREWFVDPLAQSFVVDTRGMGRMDSSGAFITKIDLYFATKDSSLPVIVEIREVDPVSGYPTPKVVPYSRTVVESSAVNTSTNGSKPTPIYFPSPVYVENGRQYAIVIIPGGGSPNYSLWIARIGDNDIRTGGRISTQPATGILFASSNDLTYTALQEEDLKFNLYFANYVVSTTGSIIFKNEPRDYFVVANVSSTDGFTRAGEWVHGETYIKGTLAPGQGITGNVAAGLSFVQGMVSGAVGVLTYLSTANGDLRCRDVRGSFKGGEAIRFRLTSNTGTIAGNSTGGIKFAQYPRGKLAVYDATTGSNTFLHLANVTYANSGPATGTAANNRTFLVNRWVKGQTDGVKAKITIQDKLNVDVINVKGDYILPSNTSLTPTGKFATSSSARDTTYKNINLNADTELDARRYIYGKSQESNTSLTFATMKDGSAEVKLALVTSNRYGSPTFDVTRISATAVESLLNNSTTNEANTVAGGSAKARYITRRVVLAEGQDAEDLKVYIDAYNPPGTAVNVYYKVLHREDSDSFDQARWQLMSRASANTEVSSSEDREDFRELEFGVSNYPTGAGQYHSGLYANSTPAYTLCYRNSLGAFYVGYKYFAIKIVLTGTNTINPPRIRKLRAIALQK